jgi:alkyl sulfatase BDS1-like metallo-beta-lactamase superfamily hydrolase
MVSGITLPEIQAKLALPDHLTPRDGRCKPHWIARSVWEEYSGWFRQERTSELYPTPPSAIWPELASMAGGAAALIDKARTYLKAGDAEKALHFVEIAFAAEPDNRGVREAELEVLNALADETEGRVFDLLGWLEGRITNAQSALNETQK